MGLAKNIFLFMLTNFCVVITIGFLCSFFGVEQYLHQSGLNIQFILIFSLIWGMGGAFISLLMSKAIIKWTMRLRVIDHNEQEPELRWLFNTVNIISNKAGLKKMPEVAIYESPDLNAFATGPSKNNSLVAVSTGLLHSMSRDEVEGVLGHEVAHIANGDMVTMTLLQGIVNSFAIFLARIIAHLIAFSKSGNDRNGNGSYMTYFMIRMLLEMVFMILGSIIVAWFSRYREYRADDGGASLTQKRKMINALKALQRNYQIPLEHEENASLNTLKIFGKKSLMNLFSSHPPLESRIAALEGRME